MTSRAGGDRRAAVLGLAAAAVALGTSELTAGLVPGAPSLVVAVADAVIDLAPPAVVDAGIELFGTADKPALLAGMLLVAGFAGAGLGVVGRRRLDGAVAGFAAFGLLGALAAARRPQLSLLAGLLAATPPVAAGCLALSLLLRRARPAEYPEEMRPGPDAGRRAFLAAAGVAFAIAATAGVAGRLLLRGAGAVAARARLVLPRPASSAPAVPAAASLPVAGLSSLFSPNDRFYRIDTALLVPRVDPADWRLRVGGLVERPFELSFGELLDLPLAEADVTLCCVSNVAGGQLIGTARWLGVPLASLLERTGVRREADQVVGRSVDGFTAGFPTAVALDGRPALVAVGMNGEPLPLDHGFPARLVVAGLYGYVSATKWLAEIELTTFDAFEGYWVPRGWAAEGPIKTSSRIDVPRPDERVAAGRVAVAGVAWAPRRGVHAVEVQVDDGPWALARLAAPLSRDTWRQWVYQWEATPGVHLLRVRATDGDGRVQEERRRPPRPDGATGHHRVRVQVVST